MRRKTFWIRSVWIGLALLFISEVVVIGNASAQSTEPLQSQELTLSLGGISGQTRSLRGSAAGGYNHWGQLHTEIGALTRG